MSCLLVICSMCNIVCHVDVVDLSIRKLLPIQLFLPDRVSSWKLLSERHSIRQRVLVSQRNLQCSHWSHHDHQLYHLYSRLLLRLPRSNSSNRPVRSGILLWRRQQCIDSIRQWQVQLPGQLHRRDLCEGVEYNSERRLSSWPLLSCWKCGTCTMSARHQLVFHWSD